MYVTHRNSWHSKMLVSLRTSQNFNTKFWYPCLPELMYDLSRTKFGTHDCWTPAQLKAPNSCNMHSKWSQVCVQQGRGGGGYWMWVSLCHVSSTLPAHGKQNGSSGVTSSPASGLSQHLVKKLLWKVGERLHPWVKRAGSALLIEGKSLVCSSTSRSDCVQAASRFAARFYYFIPFYIKIFTIDSCSSTIFK